MVGSPTLDVAVPLTNDDKLDNETQQRCVQRVLLEVSRSN
jgi:hypothetical protein